MKKPQKSAVGATRSKERIDRDAKVIDAYERKKRANQSGNVDFNVPDRGFFTEFFVLQIGHDRFWA